jgi:hypothetical protein
MVEAFLDMIGMEIYIFEISETCRTDEENKKSIRS